MTTASDLVASIDTADAETCVRALAGLNEESRRALHPAVAERIEKLDAQLQDFSSPSRERVWKAYSVARVALLGVATLGELQKIRTWTFFGADETASMAILTERRPNWLLDWAEFELTRNFRNWRLVRALVRGGFIPRPATESYILGMIAAPDRRTSPRELLDEDRELLQHELWRLFEHEGSGELSLAAYDKYVHGDNTWSMAFRRMAADGTINRKQVLVGSLDALQRDFAPFRAGWFSRLHEVLKPNGTERAELCERYLDLLNSRVPATVSFAMKALMEAHKAGALDIAAAASRLAPAFEARDKGTVERALALLSKASQKADATTKIRLAALAARALGHESPEVQTAALKLAGSDAKLIEPYLGMLAPSIRAQLGAQRPAATQTGAQITVTEMQPVQGIAILDELVETFAAVLENQGPPIDIERVIEGVARIGIPATHDAGFARLTAALARRAENVISRPGTAQPRSALAALALAWNRGFRSEPPKTEKNLSDFLVWRLWYTSEQAAQRIEQPLISLPTSPDGRIASAEFDRRLASLTTDQLHAASDPASLFHLDFVLARLRAKGTTDQPRMAISWKKRTWTADGKTYAYYEPSLNVQGAPDPGRFEPAALASETFGGTLEMKRWCATVSPRWCEGWFAAGCKELSANIDWHEANWSTRAYLEPLVSPHTPIARMGALLIALGLGAKETGESGLAVDALIAATSDQRLDAGALGSALMEAASSGVIKFVRWAKRLQQAAQAGALQSSVVFLACEALLESGEGIDRSDFGRLVELELELAHLTGLRLTRQDALRILETLSGKGKAGNAARALLKISGVA